MSRKNQLPPGPAPTDAVEGTLVHDDDDVDDDDDFDLFGDDGADGDFEYDLPASIEPMLNDVRVAVAAYEEREFGNPFSTDTQRPSAQRLRADHALVTRLTDTLEKTSAPADGLAALDERLNELVYDWMSDVAFNLAESGDVDGGVALARRWARVFDSPDEYLGDAASMLAIAGRKGEALELIDELLSRFGADLSVCDRMGDLLARLGEDKRSERLTRKVLEKTQVPGGISALADTDEEQFILRSSALERMVALLEARGARREALEFKRELDSVEQSVREIADAFGANARPQPKAEWGFDHDDEQPATSAPIAPVTALRSAGPKEKPKKR